jgi:chitin synthase
MAPYADNPGMHNARQQSMMSLAGGLQDPRSNSPYQDYPQSQPHRPSMAMLNSSDNLLNTGAPSPLHQSTSQLGLNTHHSQIGYTGGARSPIGHDSMPCPVSTFDFQRGNSGPDDMQIVEAIQSCLREVDLDTVTKKQVRALVEQRLQTELVGERRTFLDRTIDSELANM